MIIGVGTDVVEISRIGKLIQKDTAISKMFTANEKLLFESQSNKERWAAGRFAAKEAASKALKAGIARCPLNQIEVLYDESGAPTLSFIGKAQELLPQGNIKTHVTITHDYGIAMATVIVEIANDDVEIKDMVMAKEIAKLMPQRPIDAHKGDMGHVVILAGSKRYTGAGYLSAMGALKGGAGLVTWCKGYKAAMSPPEAMNYQLPKLGGIASFIKFCKGKDAVLIGPGLGVDFAKKILKRAIDGIDIPMVLDADALNALASMKSLPKLNDKTVLTPHVGEAARLLQKENRYVADNILKCARELADKTGSVVVLKSHQTVVCAPDGRQFVNTTGNAGMATGGSGDVLAGLIVALLPRLTPFDAARFGVYLHGLAGDIARLDVGVESLTAIDIAQNLPKGYKKLSNIIK